MSRIFSALFLLAALSLEPAAGPHAVSRSRTPADFAARVDAYAAELAQWRRHQACVEADAVAGKPRAEACQAYPPPLAPPDVMASVGADGRPSFVVVDDGPTPKQALAAKKKALLAKVAEAQQQALDELVPPGKWQSMLYRERDIQELQKKPGPQARQFMAEMKDVRRRIDLIMRAAAKAASDVADLAAEDVDAWAVPPL